MARLSLLLLIFCCVACTKSSPPLFEIGVEEIQAAGISSYDAYDLRPNSDQSRWSGEACVDEPTSDQIFVYQLDLVADTNYELNYYHTTMSCMSNSISLDAKLYIFDAQNRLLTSADTDDSRTVDIRFVPSETGIYYLAIAPTYQNDTGGYTVALSDASRNQ